jgi:hypothetical protein
VFAVLGLSGGKFCIAGFLSWKTTSFFYAIYISGLNAYNGKLCLYVLTGEIFGYTIGGGTGTGSG